MLVGWDGRRAGGGDRPPEPRGVALLLFQVLEAARIGGKALTWEYAR
jgi:hypothetical protein